MPARTRALGRSFRAGRAVPRPACVVCFGPGRPGLRERIRSRASRRLRLVGRRRRTGHARAGPYVSQKITDRFGSDFRIYLAPALRADAHGHRFCTFGLLVGTCRAGSCRFRCRRRFRWRRLGRRAAVAVGSGTVGSEEVGFSEGTVWVGWESGSLVIRKALRLVCYVKQKQFSNGFAGCTIRRIAPEGCRADWALHGIGPPGQQISAQASLCGRAHQRGSPWRNSIPRVWANRSGRCWQRPRSTNWAPVCPSRRCGRWWC